VLNDAFPIQFSSLLNLVRSLCSCRIIKYTEGAITLLASYGSERDQTGRSILFHTIAIEKSNSTRFEQVASCENNLQRSEWMSLAERPG
jgi:hypothetical protein